MNFDDIEISTKTIIAVSNLHIDILKIFQNFPVSETMPLEDSEISVLTIYLGNDKRGVILEEKKKKKKSFRNALNIIVSVGNNKKINFKVSKNGKFQLTGCKSEKQAINVICYFIQEIFQHCQEYVSISVGKKLNIYFQTVMTNIDFSVGFYINRQKLDEMMNQETQFHSLLETSCGYTGVNIKFPLSYKWWDIEVPVLSCENFLKSDKFEWQMQMMSLDEIGDVTFEKKNKKKYNTFLVFHSGNVIMSGMTQKTMKKDFESFTQLLNQWKNEIEEKIYEN